MRQMNVRISEADLTKLAGIAQAMERQTGIPLSRNDCLTALIRREFTRLQADGAFATKQREAGAQDN